MMEDFKDTIREAREQLGLTQEELALRLNVSQKSVSKYERGDRRPTYETLVKMSELFKVSTDYLLGAEKEGGSMLGERIKELRKEAGLTQEELGEKLGVIKQTVSSWETGTTSPDHETLAALVDVLGTSADYLLGIERGDSMEEFKNALKSARRNKGLTQEQLAQIVGVSSQVVSNWERGYTTMLSLDMVSTIAQVLNISLDEFLGTKKDISMNNVTTDYLMAEEEKGYFAENLRYLRVSKGDSQIELAEKLGIEQSTIANYEADRRNPDIPKLIKIADYFGISIDDLLRKDLRPEKPMYIKNLKYLRKLKGVTQEEIAKVIGLKSKSSCCHVESGKWDFSIEQIMKLADYFGVTLDQFVKQDLSETEG